MLDGQALGLELLTSGWQPAFTVRKPIPYSRNSYLEG